MDPRFEQFCQERKYLANVSPRTIEWYRASLKWLGNQAPDEATLKDFVMRMRNAGLKPSSCNCRIRAVNAYLRLERYDSVMSPVGRAGASVRSNCGAHRASQLAAIGPTG